MQRQSGFHNVGLVFFSLLILFALQPKRALATSTTPPCNDSSSPYYNLDTIALNNAASHQQAAYTAGVNAVNQFPVASAAQLCANKIDSAFSSLGGLTSSTGVAGLSLSSALSTAFTNITNQVTNQICSSLTGAIGATAGSSSLSSIAKICLPMPSFNLSSFSLPSVAGCSGGMPISLMQSNTGSKSPTGTYNYQQFLQ
ncbi:MAG: hypothetical protein P4M13_04655 [Alphaproteobacteria bacterium]|nr:hypothetical protein [Alphaproteobacteria bacterium]